MRMILPIRIHCSEHNFNCLHIDGCYEPEGVKESTESLHEAEDADGEDSPEAEDDPEEDAATPVGGGEPNSHHHAPQHLTY